MKKHELLKKAYDDYPKGTRFKSVTGIENTSTGIFRFLDGDAGIVMEGGNRGCLILGAGFEIWAEIITEQSHTLKVGGAEKTTSFEVYETELRLNVNSQTFVFTKDFLEKHLLPAVKAYKKLNKK